MAPKSYGVFLLEMWKRGSGIGLPGSEGRGSAWGKRSWAGFLLRMGLQDSRFCWRLKQVSGIHRKIETEFHGVCTGSGGGQRGHYGHCVSCTWHPPARTGFLLELGN